MSLTRKEWINMWSAIKAIENNSKATYSSYQHIIDANIQEIKDLIQKVIGQMEYK